MTTETIQLIEKKASEMTGQRYMFNGTGEAYTVKNTTVVNSRLLINTDKKLFDVELEHAMKLLNEFHSGVPVAIDAEHREVAPFQTTSATVYQAPHQVQSLTGVQALKDIIMNNIERVKADKEYVPQAAAVNDSLKTLIELAKVEIKALELQERLG